LSPQRLTLSEIQFLQNALSADYIVCDIRLREGEYQYDLAKSIASFQLELCFPDAKDIIERLYGEGKSDEIQFIRKIQTILKKMERSKVVRILPKNKPWELQRYALLSFKFQDAEKNLLMLATEQEIKQTQDRLNSTLSLQGALVANQSYIKTKIGILAFIVVASYSAIVWALTQPTIEPIIFVLAFCIALTCSLILGKTLSMSA